MSRRTYVACLVLSVAAYLLVTLVQVQRDPRPLGSPSDIQKLADRDDVNVVFILVDTLRADRLGAHGYHRETSPFIDYLARSGIRFERNRAQSSWTKCSMASLWTSLYPQRTGVLRYAHALPEVAQLAPEALQSASFATVGVWRNGWVAPNFGFRQGFDVYQSPPTGQSAELRKAARAGRILGSDADVTSSAVEFLRTARDERFFLYIHYMDVHQFASTEEFAKFGTGISDSYDNAIAWVDSQISLVAGALDEFGMRDRTVIIVASDHGEAFGEHGIEGHAKDVFSEVTHTPFVISLPFRLDDGIVVESSSQNVDLFPTLFDLLGLPEVSDTDGQSRLPAILAASGSGGDAEDSQEPEFDVAQLDRYWGRVDQEPKPILAVRSGDHRLIREYHAGSDEYVHYLYDVASDWTERDELITAGVDPSAALVAELAGRIDEIMEATPPWGSDALEVELDDMSLGQLRALGYVVQ